MGRPKWGGAYAARWVRLTLDTFGTTCHLCGRGPRSNPPAPAANSADHIIPRSRRGPDSLANLRPVHHLPAPWNCNRRRGNRTLAEWFRENPQLQTRATLELKPSRDWFSRNEA